METDEAFALVKVKYNLSLVLKKEQFEVIDSLLHGRNVIAILPTGFGKSLMFVLPPLLLDEVCVLYEIVSFVFTRNALSTCRHWLMAIRPHAVKSSCCLQFTENVKRFV